MAVNGDKGRYLSIYSVDVQLITFLLQKMPLWWDGLFVLIMAKVDTLHRCKKPPMPSPTRRRRRPHLLIYQRVYQTIPWQLLQKPIVRYLSINMLHQHFPWLFYRRMIALILNSWYLQVPHLTSWTPYQTHTSQMLNSITLGFGHLHHLLLLIRPHYPPHFILTQVCYLLSIAQGVKILMSFHLALFKVRMPSQNISIWILIPWVSVALPTSHTHPINLLYFPDIESPDKDEHMASAAL